MCVAQLNELIGGEALFEFDVHGCECLIAKGMSMRVEWSVEGGGN